MVSTATRIGGLLRFDSVAAGFVHQAHRFHKQASGVFRGSGTGRLIGGVEIDFKLAFAPQDHFVDGVVAFDFADFGVADENICHRIIENFVMPVPITGAEVSSSASIGVAVFPDHGATLDSLYKSADVALYEAKRAGGNMWRWYRTSTAASGKHPTIKML